MAASLSLIIYVGDSKQINIVFRDKQKNYIDITDREYTAQVRKTSNDPNVLAEFTCTVTNGAEGKLSCSLTPEQTALLKPGSAKWDLQEISGDSKITLLRGTVSIQQDVTRP